MFDDDIDMLGRKNLLIILRASSIKVSIDTEELYRYLIVGTELSNHSK